MKLIKTNERRVVQVAALGCLALLAAVTAFAGEQAGDDPQSVRIALAKDDSLAVRFTEPFNAGDLSKGFVPTAVVAADKIVAGAKVFETGAPVAVEVIADQVKDNGRAGKAGQLKLVFASVTASNGKDVPVVGGIDRKGNGRGIIVKIFTLFLIKGEDPAIEPTDTFYAKFAETTFIYVDRP